jgi:hypothetical protein
MGKSNAINQCINRLQKDFNCCYSLGSNQSYIHLFVLPNNLISLSNVM